MIYDILSEMIDRSSDPIRPRTDSLSQVLKDFRLSGASYGRCDLSSRWGIEFPPQQDAGFHFVVDELFVISNRRPKQR